MVILGFSNHALGSDSTKCKLKKYVTLNGYIKHLNTLTYFNGNTINDDLLHNRININTKNLGKLSASIQIRNRIFTGDNVKFNPIFANGLDKDNGIMDLSFMILDNKNVAFNSKIDRLWLMYQADNWELKLGRQRINWGINTVWNPNDLFNAYNFTDFDYIERPGSDAIRYQHFGEKEDAWDIAFAPSRNMDSSIAAVMYKFNKKEYDIQLITAKYIQDVSMGIGWAGNIKNAGFKGEVSYFTPYNGNKNKDVVSASMGFDYSFKNGINLNLSSLYNSSNITFSPASFTAQNGEPLSAKNLMPSKFTYFAQVSKSMGPAVNLSLATMYVQSLKSVFLMPSVAYIINNNWGIDLISQHLISAPNNKIQNLYANVNFRLVYYY